MHSCIYLIDPDSIMTPSARRARSRLAAAAFPAQPLSPSDLPEPSEYDSGSDEEDANVVVPQGGESDDEYGEPEPPPLARAPLTPISPGDRTPRNSVDPESEVNKISVEVSPSQSGGKMILPKTPNRLAMSPAEIRVIARLAKRVNVLPVVARADTLTDGRLERVKRAVRRDLQSVGIEDDSGNIIAGVFAVWDAEPGSHFGRRSSGKENAGGALNGGLDDEYDHDDERQSRPVIKLRGTTRGLVRSRSRKSLKTAVGAEYDEPDVEVSPGYPSSPQTTGHGNDAISVTSPSRRTSLASARGTDAYSPTYGAMFSRADLRARMPFAIIAPERDRAVKKAADTSQNGHHHPHGVQAPSVSGRFVRRFRWGTVDVLDPQHCDFAALRAAVLGSYMRVRIHSGMPLFSEILIVCRWQSLKATTKDVLYERFRTEKLLARRATAHISDSARQRIFKGI